MQGVKGTRRHLAGKVEMSEIGTRMVSTRVAPARRIEGSIVLGITGVPDVEAAFAGEQLTVARVTRRHDAVEHVDAPGNALDEVFRRPRSHQIPGSVEGQRAGGLFGDPVHDLYRFANADAADR